MFPSPLDRYCTNLDDWLAIATAGLADDVRTRILEEMSAHYAEAVAELVANGVSNYDAQQQALRELGSPVKARRAYQATFAVPSHIQNYERELAAAEAHANRPRLREILFVLALFWMLPGLLPPSLSLSDDIAASNSWASAVLLCWSIGLFILAPRIARTIAAKWGRVEAYRTLFAAHLIGRTVLAAALWSINSGPEIPWSLRAVAPAVMMLVNAQELHQWKKTQPRLSE